MLVNKSALQGSLLLLPAIFCLLLSGGQAQATHLRAGNIKLTRVGDCGSGGGITYTVRIEVYINIKDTDVLFGGANDYLDFGDRKPRVKVPEIRPNDPRYSTVGMPPGTAYVYFEINHYFDAGTYTVSYVEENRNAGILNMDSPVQTPFYLETQVVVDPYLGCNTPVHLGQPPLGRACTGVAWFHNPQAVDPDGMDSISYQMVVPYRDRGASVFNYQSPAAARFYTQYAQGNEAGTGIPTFTIDQSGNVVWDAPGMVGEYNIAFIIIDWRRKTDGTYQQVGFVRRDMQIVVEDCDNKRPDLIVPDDICVTAGDKIQEYINAYDLDSPPDDVRITANSEIFSLRESSATFSPTIFQKSPAYAGFTWYTRCEHVREQPYTVYFKAEDTFGLAVYKAWRITVVGPAPIWNDAQLNAARRTATLKWDRYTCQNAETMQLWRKVDGTNFQPDHCQTGMPPGLGYTLIDVVSARLSPNESTGQYVDTNNGMGLAPGARYCYRLVAVYPRPGGGESYVSQEICVGPVLADVPIITNVSVERTDAQDGQVRVSWKKPIDVDPAVYPPPYEYRVYRGVGFDRANDSTLVATLFGDTTYLDGGLNTEVNVYNYNILGYCTKKSPQSGNDTTVLLGSSAWASSVRVGSTSQKDQITLGWSAHVPWSNQIEAHPYHYIFRGGAEDAEDQLQLVDSVNVTAGGLQYVDRGLTPGTTYCYRIMTRGGYGNPQRIPEPLENYSQRICVQPGDTLAPCTPVLTVSLLDCERGSIATLCIARPGTYANTLQWAPGEAGVCMSDIRYYRIYWTATWGGAYTLLEQVAATERMFVHEGLSSYAACYRISAVDYSGNESDQSDAVCNDNCPNYMLPNVFSPNGDEANPVFSAYSLRDYTCASDDCAVPEHLKNGCARFVKTVRFKVFNRWGREVYSYTGDYRDDINSIYIDWDGRDKNGSMLSPAVYYYSAEVTFDVLDPRKSVKRYKGWVHLLNEP
jgi:hypothetical protein